MVRSLEGKHPDYYEAIIQLRMPDQDIVTFVESELARGKIPIVKVVEMKNGFDYYVADNSFSIGLGKHLQERFGGELNVTSSLFGRRKGKELYRVTVLYRKAPFNKGDTVIYGGEEYIIKLMGKDIYLIGTKNKKKVHVRYRDMKLVKVKGD
jgi:nonsense-mediated mRNA decay protein 3